MLTLAVVKADDKNCLRACTNYTYCIITMGYWKFKRICDLVKLPIGYAHAIDKIVNIVDMLLVGLCCEHDNTAPRSATFLKPFIMK